MCFSGSQPLLCQKFLLAAQSRWASRTFPMWRSLLLRPEHKARVLPQHLPCICPSPGNMWRVEEKKKIKARSLEPVRGYFFFSLVTWIFNWRTVFSSMHESFSPVRNMLNSIIYAIINAPYFSSLIKITLNNFIRFCKLQRLSLCEQVYILHLDLFINPWHPRISEVSCPNKRRKKNNFCYAYVCLYIGCHSC